MKGFKKLALVAAIAAPMTSVHALEALDDSTLSGMTGQAGVTIELDTKVTIDSFTYTDEGSVVLGDIAFGGANVAVADASAFDSAASDRLDEVKIDIDVDAGGNLQIHLGSTDVVGVFNGSNPLDFGLHVGTVGLTDAAGSVSSQIASNINLAGVLGPQDIVILNDASANGMILAQGYFEIKDGGLTVDVAGVGVSNLTIGQDSNPFHDDTKLGGPLAAGGKLLAPYAAATAAAGLTNTTAAENWAFYAITVDTATSAAGGVTDALSLTVDSFNVDIAMDVGIGNGSASNIGHIALDNLDVSGTTMVVYGH